MHGRVCAAQRHTPKNGIVASSGAQRGSRSWVISAEPVTKLAVEVGYRAREGEPEAVAGAAGLFRMDLLGLTELVVTTVLPRRVRRTFMPNPDCIVRKSLDLAADASPRAPTTGHPAAPKCAVLPAGEHHDGRGVRGGCRGGTRDLSAEGSTHSTRRRCTRGSTARRQVHERTRRTCRHPGTWRLAPR